MVKINNASSQVLYSQVFSFDGQTIQTDDIPVGYSNFKINTTNSGFYFVKITNPITQSSSTFKIVLL